MILVTGATGFIGRRLVARLQDRGQRLRALVRPESMGKLPQQDGLDVAPGDITDPTAVTSAMHGCSAVIHLAAARARWARNPEMFERVNVRGSRTVMEAALHSRVEKFLHVSTHLVLGPSNGTPRTEADFAPLARFFSEYQRTKYLAEGECRRLMADGLPAVILYPTTVYGPSEAPEESPVTDVALALARRPFVPIPGSGALRRNLVYVDDVADGILLAFEGAPPAASYILGGENASPLEFLSTLAEVTGRPARPLFLPAGALRGAAWALEGIARMTRRAPPLTRSTVDILNQEWTVSSDKAATELGYRSRTLREGLYLTLNPTNGAAT